MISAARMSVVTTITRTAMSIRASVGMLGMTCHPERSEGSGGANRHPDSSLTLGMTLLSNLSDECEHRHVHRDDDAADGNTEERDEDRLEKLHEAGHGVVDFVFVEVGDLRQHRIERASLLADRDHLHDHRR